jgi:hypothetical protein
MSAPLNQRSAPSVGIRPLAVPRPTSPERRMNQPVARPSPRRRPPHSRHRATSTGHRRRPRSSAVRAHAPPSAGAMASGGRPMQDPFRERGTRSTVLTAAVNLLWRVGTASAMIAPVLGPMWAGPPTVAPAPEGPPGSGIVLRTDVTAIRPEGASLIRRHRPRGHPLPRSPLSQCKQKLSGQNPGPKLCEIPTCDARIV